MKKWHTTLNEVAYRMSCHGATKVSPYQLVYGHEAVLPWETRLGSRRVTFQDQLTADDYTADEGRVRRFGWISVERSRQY